MNDAVFSIILETEQAPQIQRGPGAAWPNLGKQVDRVVVILRSSAVSQRGAAGSIARRDPSEYGQRGGDVPVFLEVIALRDKISHVDESLRVKKANLGIVLVARAGTRRTPSGHPATDGWRPGSRLRRRILSRLSPQTRIPSRRIS